MEWWTVALPSVSKPSENIEIETSANNIKEISLKSEFKNAFGSEIIKTKNISINEELIKGLLSQYKWQKKKHNLSKITKKVYLNF